MNESTVIKGREMFGIVMVTCPLDFVEIITTSLLKKRLAAAINILPTIHSWYWWENSIHSTKEALLLVKTLTSEFPKLEQTVRELHPYQVPSIVMLPIVASSDDYTNWISQEVNASPKT
jgi:periplasmic divalent cation tolerance protein